MVVSACGMCVFVRFRKAKEFPRRFYLGGMLVPTFVIEWAMVLFDGFELSIVMTLS